MSLAPTNRPYAVISSQPFKPLSPETIKAGTTNPIVEASICQNGDALSQCSRIRPEAVVPNPRGDEPEMKL
jgi:hypothetical protein